MVLFAKVLTQNSSPSRVRPLKRVCACDVISEYRCFELVHHVLCVLTASRKEKELVAEQDTLHGLQPKAPQPTDVSEVTHNIQVDLPSSEPIIADMNNLDRFISLVRAEQSGKDVPLSRGSPESSLEIVTTMATSTQASVRRVKPRTQSDSKRGAAIARPNQSVKATKRKLTMPKPAADDDIWNYENRQFTLESRGFADIGGDCGDMPKDTERRPVVLYTKNQNKTSWCVIDLLLRYIFFDQCVLFMQKSRRKDDLLKIRSYNID